MTEDRDDYEQFRNQIWLHREPCHIICGRFIQACSHLFLSSVSELEHPVVRHVLEYLSLSSSVSILDKYCYGALLRTFLALTLFPMLPCLFFQEHVLKMRFIANILGSKELSDMNREVHICTFFQK